MSQGDVSLFLTRPLSASMLALAVLLLFLPLFGRLNQWRVRAIEMEGAGEKS